MVIYFCEIFPRNQRIHNALLLFLTSTQNFQDLCYSNQSRPRQQQQVKVITFMYSK